MTGKQKVYIKGVLGRSDEVKQALIDLGGKAVYDFDYSLPDYLYFINHNGEIEYVGESSEMGKIIMDHYTELSLPDNWKDGDVLVSRSNSQVMVLYEFISEKEADLFNAYFRIDCGSIFLHPLEVRKRFRLATEQEVERFYEILHEHHKDWDVEKKQLIDWQWKPKESEKYWVVITGMGVRFFTCHNDSTDKFWFNSGNCFRTKEEAEAMAEKINKLLKGE